jgi:hypothetical protein
VTNLLDIADAAAVDSYEAARRLFQKVDAAQEGALAGAARANDADHLAEVDGKRDTVERPH